MSISSGRVIPLSLPRRLICDLVHFGSKLPAVTVQRRMHIPEVARIRAKMQPRPSWCAIFTKAYSTAIVAYPQLRRAFLRWPRPRLYEHPANIASVAVERNYLGEPAVLFAHIRSPDQQPLTAIDEYLRRLKSAPIESIGCFRRGLAISRLPLFVRRWLWWWTLNCWGHKRAKRLGTFGVSVYSGLGASSLNPISPLTSTLNYDVIQEDGSVDVRVIYDHRVLDGGSVARAMAEMETILNQDILDELTYLDREQRTISTSRDAGEADEQSQLLVRR